MSNNGKMIKKKELTTKNGMSVRVAYKNASTSRLGRYTFLLSCYK